MTGETIRMHKSKTVIPFYYNFATAKQERACNFGCKIAEGARYVTVYHTNEAGDKIINHDKFCQSHYRICENCGAPHFRERNRFCSDGCGQAQFERETMDHDENMFYGRDSGW